MCYRCLPPCKPAGANGNRNRRLQRISKAGLFALKGGLGRCVPGCFVFLLVIIGKLNRKLLTADWCGKQRSQIGTEGEAMSKTQRLIIVGGSAAGPSAAAKAKRVNKDLEVMIFEKGDFVSYGA